MTAAQAIGRYRKTARVSVPAAPAIPVPIKIAEFWKNQRGFSVRVELTTYEGQDLVDVRSYATAADGTMQPTRKGISLSIRKLPELLAALVKARDKAAELGLLDEDGAQ